MSYIDILRQELIRKNFKPNTVKSYCYHVNKFLSWLDIDVFLVTEVIIRKYLMHMVVRGYQPASVRLILAALNFFFRYIVIKKHKF